MAVPANIKYISEFIRLQIASASYLPASVSSGATSMRVLNINVFDPAGGTCYVGDSFITYTGISDDKLTGIPASGDGSIASTLNEVTNASPSLVYIQGISEKEMEAHTNRFRSFVNSLQLEQDADKKRYWGRGSWFDTDVEIRDDDDSSYNTVTPDTSDYENGVFEFNTARTETALYLAGWRYNPFYVIAEILMRAANGDQVFKQLIPKNPKERTEITLRAVQFQRRGRILEI